VVFRNAFSVKIRLYRSKHPNIFVTGKEINSLFEMPHDLISKPRVDIHSKTNVSYWSSELECSEEELLYCISKVGSSINAIESYLHMNKSLLQIWSSSDIAI
jgi:hypothetical protein